MFQRVVASIGEVVGKFKKKLDDLQVDLLEAIQLRNDAVEENEAILSEKQEQLLENQRLEREFTMRTRLAQTTCSTLQNRISNDLYDKNMLYGFILCMFRVIVAILFGIALKK
jgi:predicted transcriptional regulator